MASTRWGKEDSSIKQEEIQSGGISQNNENSTFLLSQENSFLMQR